MAVTDRPLDPSSSPARLDGPARARAHGPPDPTLAQGRPVRPGPAGDRHGGSIGTCWRLADKAPSTAGRASIGSRWTGCAQEAADSEALAVHELLWPVIHGRVGAPSPETRCQRRCRPMRKTPAHCSGRHLRRVCLSLLHHGELALRDLHLLLILHGFTLTGSAPIKALRRVVGYEHDHGQVRAGPAGHKPADTEDPQPRPDPQLGTAPEDWYPALVASLPGRQAHSGQGAPRPAPRWPAGTSPGRRRRRPWLRGGSGRRRPR